VQEMPGLQSNSITNRLPALCLLAAALVIRSLASAQSIPLSYESEDGQFKYILHNELTREDIEVTASVLEDYYRRVLSDLNVESVPKTTVTIWNDPASYYRVQEETTGQRFEGSGGYAWWGAAPELRLQHSTRRGAAIGALHEFAHIVSMARNKTIPNNPRWLWEATALYATRDLQPSRIPIFIMQRDFPTLSELNVGFNYANEQRSIYDVGFFLAEYIVENWGNEAIGQLVESNGDIPTTLKVSVSEFEQGWITFLTANYLD